MTQISASGLYTLRIEGRHEQLEPAHFTLNTALGVPAVVAVRYDTKDVVCLIEGIQVPPDFVELVSFQQNFEDLPQHLKQEVSSINTALSLATKKVLSIVKYYLRHVGISETLFATKAVTWRTDAAHGPALHLPIKLQTAISTLSSEPLRKNTIDNIQGALDDDLSTLLALPYLHRARQERLPHHKWINATIAAELAVKEVLVIVNPELESLLMELPSPPLGKLYGSILERYLGERSPFLKEIDKGVVVRNRLVHRPEEYSIPLQEAIDYVDAVEGAIFHLLYKAYPNSPLIANAYWHLRPV